MTPPLMPKATAVWLIENTALTFDQIAAFCELHPLEVKSIADGEVAQHMVGFDPVANGQVTQAEIERCSADPSARLVLSKPEIAVVARAKGPRYTPVSRRQDRPDAIAWLVRNFPELSDGQISRLLGTTKPTIKAVRDRTHWNMANITPQDPVALGLCSRNELQAAIDKARRAAERAAKKAGQPVPVHAGADAGAPSAMPLDKIGADLTDTSADDSAPAEDAAEPEESDTEGPELTAEDVWPGQTRSEPEPEAPLVDPFKPRDDNG